MSLFHRAIAIAIAMATSLEMGIIIFSMCIAQDLPLSESDSDSDIAKKWVQNSFLSDIAIAIANRFRSVETGHKTRNQQMHKPPPGTLLIVY